MSRTRRTLVNPEHAGLPTANGDLQPEDLTRLARLLGQRGGEQTRKRGRDYYSRIGKLGMARRWARKKGPSSM